MLTQWLDKVRLHVPEFAKEVEAEAEAAAAAANGRLRPRRPRKLNWRRKPSKHLKPQNTLDAAASLVGRDADFAWFRFVIPAQRVMRDDSQPEPTTIFHWTRASVSLTASKTSIRVWAGNRLV